PRGNCPTRRSAPPQSQRFASNPLTVRLIPGPHVRMYVRPSTLQQGPDKKEMAAKEEWNRFVMARGLPGERQPFKQHRKGKGPRIRERENSRAQRASFITQG